VDILPNSMSFRFVTTLSVEDDDDIPADFTGRVRKSTNGVLEYVAWFNRGELEDPGPRTPAYSRYRPDGAVKQVRHYRLGRLHDPAPGFPAVRGFYANGSRRYEEHFRYGRRHDVRGRPAIVKWRLDGSVRVELHYYEGLRIEMIGPRPTVLVRAASVPPISARSARSAAV
jgi:hypothetical protein